MGASHGLSHAFHVRQTPLCRSFINVISMLSLTAPADQAAMVFTGVFMVVWVGAAVVTINAQLLGSSMYVILAKYVPKAK